MEEIILRALQELREEGEVTNDVPNSSYKKLSKEDIDDISNIRTKELFKNAFTPEREAIKDMLENVLMESMQELNIKKNDIEITNEDIDDIFNIIFED